MTTAPVLFRDKLPEHAAYAMKITKTTVTKLYSGCNSHVKPPVNSREYFFFCVFEFETGSRIEMNITEARKEYIAIPTIEPNYQDKEKAQKKALIDYNNAIEAIVNPNFAYARDKQSYCIIYHKDSDSPTGVVSKGGCSSYKLADNICQANGKAGSLSPTEDLRTAH